MLDIEMVLDLDLGLELDLDIKMDDKALDVWKVFTGDGDL